MTASAERKHHSPTIDLTELSLELARLDVSTPSSLGNQIVSALAMHLGTDRVSLVVLGPRKQRFARVVCHGFELSKRDWHKSSKVIDRVVRDKRELYIYDIQEQPELIAPWADDYRTDAFAVIPLIFDHRVKAVVCLSNLSRQQLLQLENGGKQIAVIQAQLRQLGNLLINSDTSEEQSCSPAADDELALIGELMEKLDQTVDTRNVFQVFDELISAQLPLEMMAIMHHSLGEKQRSIICLNRPAHADELANLHDDLSRQWQRRHRRAPRLEMSDAAFFGGELLIQQGECPPDLVLGRCETFPVFIDNDLFALATITASDDVLSDRRRMRLFNILLHQLLLFVKKSLLQAQNQEMQTVDALTGLYNERHFYQMLDREFERAGRYEIPLGLLIIDVDHFKDVNETYGFETGDMLLQEISHILMENIRSTDLVSRYSGERFVVVLPETHYKNSEIMGNRLRRFVENNSFFIPHTNVFIKVTVSIGVASHLDHKPTSLAQFIEFADTALYFAKRAGRNQVIGYDYVIKMMASDTENES